MVVISMMPTKLATLGLLKIKIFWNESYDAITCVHDVTSKILSRDSNYIVDGIMWLKFENVIITAILWRFDQKNNFFEECFWFKFNNLGLALDMALKFYTTVGKGLKLRYEWIIIKVKLPDLSPPTWRRWTFYLRNP